MEYIKYILIIPIFFTSSLSFSAAVDICSDAYMPVNFLRSAKEEIQIVKIERKAYGYLNRSINNWFGGDAVQSKQNCMSCHTTLPYMFIKESGEQLTQKGYIRDLIAKRTENFKAEGFVSGSNQPWYELESSFSTESVVNASSVIISEKLANSTKPLSQLGKDLYELMWTRQKSDGSFAWLDQFGLRPHESQNSGYWGTSMAAVMGAMVENTPSVTVTKSFNYLKTNFDGQTVHNQIFSLWAHSEAKNNGFLSAAKVTGLLNKIKNSQNADGGWSQDFILKTGVTESDPYATAIISFILKKSKIDIPNEKRVKKYITDSFIDDTGSVRFDGASTAISPNRGGTSNFFSDMSTSYSLLYLSLY